MNPSPPEPPHIPDYELLRPIGRGSYGEVWLARSVTGVFRVIKVVRRNRFEDDRPYQRELEGISRFQATASGRPRQLALLHVGRNDPEGYFYYVMEPADDAETGSAIDPDRYVPLTLRELFRRRARLPATECVQLTLELARGLVVLHEANLIHRDIKPSNIIFVQRVPKLADVGLVASSEATLTCAGTPGYAPPEGAGTVAADIFSLGKVLYEIATGLDRTEFPRLPPEITEGPDAPLLREINAIVLRACHPDPRERHASAEALARDLELIQAGRSVAFYETLRQRLRTITLAAAAVAVLAALGAGLFLWRARILQQANQQTRRALYRSDLAVAQLARSSGDLGRARAALLNQIPTPGETDLRGLEWAILAHSVKGEGTPLEPVTNGVAIRQLAVDPTGRWAAAALADETGALWDLTTRRIHRRLTNVFSLGGFTSDGLLVVDEPARALRYESPEQGTVRRWETGKRLRSLLTNSGIVASAIDEPFRLLTYRGFSNIPAGTFNLADHFPGFFASAVSTDAHGDYASIGMFRQDGARRDRILTVINIPLSKPVWQTEVDSRVLWTVTSQDGSRILANIGGLQPALYCSSNLASMKRLAGHSARVESAAFSPDASMIATASADQTVRIWDALSGAELEAFSGLGKPVTSVTWFPNGHRVAAGDDTGAIRIFDWPKKETPYVRAGFHDDIHGDLAFSVDGLTLAITKTTNSIALLQPSDLSTRRELHGVFQPISFEEDGSVLVAFGSDWSIRRVALSDNSIETLASFVPREFEVRTTTASPERHQLLLAGAEGMVYHYNWSNRKATKAVDPKTNTIWAIAFSPSENEFWTGSEDGTIRRWSLQTIAPLPESLHVDSDIQCLTMSHDGRWIAIGAYRDASIRVYDRLRRTWLQARSGHRRFAQSLLFSAEDTRLISAGADGRIIFWRVPEFEQIASFDVASNALRTGDEGLANLRLSSASATLAGLTEDGRVQLWRTR